MMESEPELSGGRAQRAHLGLPRSFIFPSYFGVLLVESEEALHSREVSAPLPSTLARSGNLSLTEFFPLRKNYLVLHYHYKNNTSER